VSDETAAYLQVWVRRLAVVAFYGYAITELSTKLGIDASLYEVIARLWGLLLAAMAIIPDPAKPYCGRRMDRRRPDRGSVAS